MKFWRPGITGKLFLAIFATCIVLLISMHWAVRISFERGFIDYIKHGNEQRLRVEFYSPDPGTAEPPHCESARCDLLLLNFFIQPATPLRESAQDPGLTGDTFHFTHRHLPS